MSNLANILAKPPPRTIAEALRNWPERAHRKSPENWRDQIFYFLLPDRFSDGQERPDRLLAADLSTPGGVARIRAIRGDRWRWDSWQQSGASRFQGGTLRGIRSKLDYLRDLGVSTLWLGPLFRQRVERDTYHGYGVQDFFTVDPRFGTRQDLVGLVDLAHEQYGMQVVLDVIFNHSGSNWLYDESSGDMDRPPYRQDGGYAPIWPRSGFGTAIGGRGQRLGADDFVWPRELQADANYLRAGSGDLGAGDIDDDQAEHKRTDFCDLRKFNLWTNDTLLALVRIYQYWIALADLDGLRLDTVKHVTQEQARNFCNAIKEYAEVLGKNDFFLVAEVAGGDEPQDRYLDVTGRNLDACLDIGQQREVICKVSKGLLPGSRFFAGFCYWDQGMGSHRNYGSRHLSVSNDHDHVFGPKLRLAADAANDHQGAAAAALQLLTLGIPCLYYGMEQGLASGAEPQERKYLDNWGGHDGLLREAMFGPEHPRAAGHAGVLGEVDRQQVGFGPHGTAGWHVFNPEHPIYRRIAGMAEARRRFLPLRRGRQYQRQTSFLGYGFAFHGAGEIIAWSRIFDDQEVLVILNPHGTQARGGRIIVDRRLSHDGMQVILNTDPSAPATLQAGATVSIEGLGLLAAVALESWLLGPSEVLILGNRPAVKAALAAS